MTKVYCWAPIIDPQQESKDLRMKKLIANVGTLNDLWKGDANIAFVAPSYNLLSGSYDITGAVAGDVIIVYGHGSPTDNRLYNFEDDALTKCNQIVAKDLPQRLRDTDWLKTENAYKFMFCVCFAGKYKDVNLLFGTSGSFIEEFRDAARSLGCFKNSILWGPKGVAYREISAFGWMEYEDDAKKKSQYTIKQLLTDGEVHINAAFGYQCLKI